MSEINVKEVFGRNVRRAREARGFTQEQFAEMIEIGVPALSNIECGKSYPTYSTIEKIIQVLNIKPCLLYIMEESFDLEDAYKDMLVRLEKLKANKTDFKLAYDFVVELTKDI